MNNNLKKLRNNLFSVFVLVTLALSIPTLIINQGFYYSDFEESSKITLSLTEGEISEDIYSGFQSFIGLTRIDRNNNVIYFQNSSSEVIKDLVEDTMKDTDVSFEYSDVIPERSQSEALNSIARGMIVFFVVSLLGLIYFVYRNSIIEGGYASVVKLLGIEIVTILSSMLIQLTLISVISRFYQVREIDIISILITGIWTNFLFILSWLQLRGQAKHTISEVLENLKSNNSILRNYLMIAIIFIAVPLFFGMGVNFVIPAVLISSALLMPIPVITTLAKFKLRFDKRNKKSKASVDKKVTKAKEESKVETSSKPWKKFNKRKVKK